MAEWFKALILKISLLKNIVGSNPILSKINYNTYIKIPLKNLITKKYYLLLLSLSNL